MTVLNIKDKIKNNKLNLSGCNITDIPVKEIVSMQIHGQLVFEAGVLS